MKPVGLLVVMLPAAIAACAAPVTVKKDATIAVPDAKPLAAPTTRYRVGDFIVYRYSGAFSTTPVLLREEVRAQQGNRLRIDVTAGGEIARFEQILAPLH